MDEPEIAVRRRQALLAGMREALGVPALVLAASYVGFGSLVRESGLSLGVALASTATSWALPGQIAMIELYAGGASLLAVALAVWLVNVRLMPMVITLMPYIDDRRVPRWRYYVLSHLVAVTSWANGMRVCPDLPQVLRHPFFVGLGVTLWLASLGGAALGYFLAAGMPQAVTLGLVFLNPVYFLLLFVGDLRHRTRALGLALGAVLGPLLHILTPDWGLMLTGLIAGTLAFAGGRLLERRHHG